MASFRPVQVFGLAVPPGEEAVPPLMSGESAPTFRLTMAAIDPTLSTAEYAQVNGTPAFTGATLKLIRIPDEDDDSEDDSEDEDFDLEQLIGRASSDEDDSEEDEDEDDEDDEDEDDDEEVNGGPSDPSKSPKAKREAALQKFKDALKQDGHAMDVDDEDEGSDNINGIPGSRLTAKQKGKAKALDLEDMDDSEDDEYPDFPEPEEMVLCTLDLSRNYQQPLDITINEHETVLFQASGTHTVYLTGNILIPEDLPAGPGMFDPDDDEDEEYDLSPDEDELDLPSEEDESDELDDLDDPRVTELDSEDEDEQDAPPPKLVTPAKGKNKRAREDSDDDAKPSLDDTLNKSLKPANASTASDKPQINGEQQLSKSQLKKLRKKLKDNAGNGVEPVSTSADVNEDIGVAESKNSQSPAGSTKKVQFAKTLVQGPTSSASNGSDSVKSETKAVNGVNSSDSKPQKPTLGVKVVQGVTMDDKKLGSGPVAKKGDKVSMRYIGKLEKDKKVFDSNKKGKPFTFQLGASQVIKGWDIGVQGMSVGGERRITIPPPLGYGNRAQGNDIPANSTLVFDIKMLNIS